MPSSTYRGGRPNVREYDARPIPEGRAIQYKNFDNQVERQRPRPRSNDTTFTLAGLNRLLPAKLSAKMNMRNQVQSKTLNHLGCCLLVCSRGDVDLYDWVELMSAIY
jgi:hypothetical protein